MSLMRGGLGTDIIITDIYTRKAAFVAFYFFSSGELLCRWLGTFKTLFVGKAHTGE